MRLILRRPLAVAAVAGLAVVVIGTSVVIGAVATSGGAVTNVRTSTEDGIVGTTSNIPTDMTGMTLSVNVPASQNAMFIITFSGESTCYGAAHAWCYVHVLFDGARARPGDVVFDATDDSTVTGTWKVNSMQWVLGPAGPGTHYVRVQFWTNAGATFFGVGPRTLTILRAQV